MKIINKARGTGKTVELIHVSDITGARIITSNSMQADFIKQKAEELGCNIPLPLTIKEVKGMKESSITIPYLIDDLDRTLDYILKDYFKHDILAVTMSVGQEQVK